MSEKYKFKNPSGVYFISFSVVYWIDLFTRPEYKNILLESFTFCIQNKGLQIHAWCIMTSHVHMIVSSLGNPLEDIIRDMKSFTSTKIKSAILENGQESRKDWMLWMMKRAGLKNSNNNDFQLWQQHNHPIQLYSNEVIHQKIDYIHYNPVMEGFVNLPHEYKYSSAIDYSGSKGLIDIEKIINY